MRNKKIVYVLKRFPRLSETFILEEMLGLEKKGFELLVLAMADPKEKFIDPDVAQLRASVIYLGEEKPNQSPIELWSQIIKEHLFLSKSDPQTYKEVIGSLVIHGNFTASMKNIAWGIKIARLCQGEDVGHIHGGFAHSPASAGMIAARILKLPFSMAGHAKDIYTSSPDSLARKILQAQFILSCSSRARDEIRSRTLDLLPKGELDKLLLVHHGVDSNRFRPPETKPSEPNGGEITLLGVGRLVEKKGYATLIDAFAKVACEREGVKLRLVGDGPLKSELKDMVKSYQLQDRVQFLGALERDGVLKEMQSADIFVHPSIVLKSGDQDGIPNVLLEAMGCALAVVGADIQGIKEVITNDLNGVIVKSGDTSALAGAIVELVDSPKKRQAISSKGRQQVVRNYSKEAAIETVSSLMAISLDSLPVP
ncbi:MULTISPECIES: glycosyltransferase family 4 protein [Acidithrix]|uniref:GDP-mannose-dependent alpha-(1-6)-phosphatidylinositol monomannoside mannosyltransferase n=1 Tax=Acidithrix ferrooxidans TaxID=1280514 RepID=A0A0D8HEX1_9ACTN|nr:MULTISPECIES: glycosyltransferase family 4 protein [Acidithrix]KJF16332.1 GDP-mannose-dependent alpha-(1-6)-phosphatidylinositol monomannoside mannosyltransferase [Acidithrix ferrooxidans]CAG4922698.1 unnamed protein product [Acidithrix sp. C25]